MIITDYKIVFNEKIFILLYGVAAYLLFLFTILYAIGFVGNFVVPKSIDSGEGKRVTHALLINSFLLGLFAIQHSVMARPAFKKWWTTIVNPAIERSTYVLLASLALLLLYWQWKPVSSIVWETQMPKAKMFLNGLYFLGWIIVFLSTFMINHFELFGLKQVLENFKKGNLQSGTSTFKVNFFYTIVRHPIMLGFLIAFWATPVMTAGHLIFSVTTARYIFIATKFLEERDLRRIHGRQYTSYQKRVPMIIPFAKKMVR